jgi:hypothetical protein
MRQSRILIGELMPALVPFPLLVWLYRHHFREEKEHVVNRMDHWLLAVRAGSWSLMDQQKSTVETRSLSSIY